MKYMGSKARHAKELLPIILKDHKPYEVLDTYQKSCKIADENGKEIWISGAAFRKYFYKGEE